MKRIALTMIALLMIAFPLFSQTVSIPDTAFLYALIEEGVDTNKDSLISYAEAEAVNSLDVSGEYLGHWDYDSRGITSLEGIEAFVNLDTLICAMNEIPTLELPNNHFLKYLDCWYTQLSYLDVTKNIALKFLDCSNNKLTSLDISNNIALEVLNIGSEVFFDEPCEVFVWESFPAGVTVNTFGSVIFIKVFNDTRHIRFGSTGDPLNGLTIAWKSQGTADSIAWGYNPDLENGESAGVMSTSITGTQFEYTFPALIAGSTIHYALFDSQGNEWLETRTYHTVSDASNNQFSFTVLGDSRSNPDQWGIIADAILDTDFTLFMGDIIRDGAIESDWDDWFEYGNKFVSRELVYHTIGNHDDDNSPSGSENYEGLYTLPGNELYYSFTYGNALFICLNSLKSGDTEQYNWLLSTLEANKDQTWKIVFFHKPFYTSPSHEGEMDEYFNTWWKAFDDYGVDMIFNGHTHNYQRTKPINRNISTTSPVATYGSGEGQGRCQIVSGAAGAPLYGQAAGLWWLEKSRNKMHFCNIDIDGDLLTFKAMDANQVVFDELVLDKSYVGINDFRSTFSRIYPNPTNDLLTIETGTVGHHTIKINSLNGQLISSFEMEGTLHQIDLSSFQKGVYFITIRSKDFITTRKIIKL